MMQFISSQVGMIKTTHFINDDILTTQYYQKLGVEGLERKEPE